MCVRTPLPPGGLVKLIAERQPSRKLRYLSLLTDPVHEAFPKARAVTIGECASHAPVLAAIGPCVSKGSGEQYLAGKLYAQLEEDWLLIADRDFYNWEDGEPPRTPARHCCGG